MTFHLKAIAATLALAATPGLADPGAYLEVTLQIAPENRGEAAVIYTQFRQPFLETIDGAEQKFLLVRDADVQVLHGFTTEAKASAYLDSQLFADDIVNALAPYLEAEPEIRVYAAP